MVWLVQWSDSSQILVTKNLHEIINYYGFSPSVFKSLKIFNDSITENEDKCMEKTYIFIFLCIDRRTV